MTSAGFPHSETLGSQLVCQLPEDYRRLQRPSSAPSAKASTNVPLKTSTTRQNRNHEQTPDPTPPVNEQHQREYCPGTIQKMLASTMQFSSNGRTHQAHRMHHHRHAGWSAHHLMTRIHQRHPQPQPDPPEGRTWSRGRLPQDPTVCSSNPSRRPGARSNRLTPAYWHTHPTSRLSSMFHP